MIGDPMDDIRVRVCGYELLGRLGRDKAPKTVDYLWI